MGLAQYADDGLFSPRKIASALRTTSEEIARTAGPAGELVVCWAVPRKTTPQDDLRAAALVAGPSTDRPACRAA